MSSLGIKDPAMTEGSRWPLATQHIPTLAPSTPIYPPPLNPTQVRKSPVQGHTQGQRRQIQHLNLGLSLEGLGDMWTHSAARLTTAPH